MRIKFVFALIALNGLSLGIASAQYLRREVNLETLYRQVDEAMEQFPQYVADFERRVERQKEVFYGEPDAEKRLSYGMELYDMYRSYKNDSALLYIRKCITLADSLRRYDIAGQARSKMARQCSNSGMYIEAGNLLDEVNVAYLTRQGKADYYEARNHLCGEIATYSLLPEVKERYFAMQSHFRDSLNMVADPSGEQYFMQRIWDLIAQNKLPEALEVSEQWINKVGIGTREDALASYYRHIVYDYMRDGIMVRFWLGNSALADIKNAVMDQASLIMLAYMAINDGDMERSYRYIRFTWDCNNFFNTRMRTSQISPVLDIIEKNYQASVERKTRFLSTASIVFTFLTLLLFAILYYVYHQKRKLAKAKKDLLSANEQLSETNEKLQRMNDWVTKCNKKLFDINAKLKNEGLPQEVSQQPQ